MKFNSRSVRRGGALAVLTGAGALVALGPAQAWVSGVGSGPLPVTNAPDLSSATITRTVLPQAGLGPQVRYCFDGPVATVTATSFNVRDYDTFRLLTGVSAGVDPGDARCVNVTFAAGRDVEQFSLGTVATGAAVDVGGTGNPAASVPLTGSTLTQVPGTTTGPELAGATVDNANDQVTFTFDENLTDETIAGYDPTDFRAYLNSTPGGAGIAGTGIVGTTAKSIVVQFANTNSYRQVSVDQGAVTDVVSNAVVTPSSIGSAVLPGQPGVITSAPSLVGASKNPDNQSVVLTFSQGVNPGAAGNVIAYREDGAVVAAQTLTTTGDVNNTALVATFPGTLQDDAASVIRVAVTPGAATARSAGANANLFTAAAIGTPNFRPGYTDGPDLLATVIDDAQNRALFLFDEAIDDTAPDATQFQVTNPDGTTQPGQAGGAILTNDNTAVNVLFGGSVSAASGVANNANAVQDESPQLNQSPEGSVGVGPIQQPQPGTTDPTPAPPGTGVPPGTTPDPGGGDGDGRRTRVRGRIKRLRSPGRRVKGNLNARGRCDRNRRVVVLKVKRGKDKKLGNDRTSSTGRFNVRTRRHKRGKLRVVIRRKLTPQLNCRPVKKRVRGRN